MAPVVGMMRAIAATVAVGLALSAPAAHAVEFDETTIQAPNGVLAVEVARTPEQRGHGLMQRADLPPGHGMVFVYAPAREVRMWMFDTLIPLDIVFVRDGRVLEVARNAQPCPVQPCPTYSTDGPVDVVIEIGAGQAQNLGFEVGTAVPSIGPAVRAQTGAGASLIDSDGTTWNSYTREEFLALPQVRQFDDVISDITAGTFRGMSAKESEGGRAREDLIYRKGVTRIVADRTKRSWSITYVAGDRECSRIDRTERHGRPSSDSGKAFDCGKADRGTLRGEVFASDLLASQVPEPALGGPMAYLVRANPAIPDGGLAAMDVIVMGAGALESVGISPAPPQTRMSIVIRPDRVDNDLAESNGIEWQYSFRTAQSAKVPKLVRVPGL